MTDNNKKNKNIQSVKSKTIIIIDDNFFDVSKYKKFHPGGSKILEKYHNKDATEAFNNIRGHCDSYVLYILDQLHIGKR
tara:strand:- start:1264 stop:1500 length:237 start_codon:yes stop_codon:yes gene_type:complete